MAKLHYDCNDLYVISDTGNPSYPYHFERSGDQREYQDDLPPITPSFRSKAATVASRLNFARHAYRLPRPAKARGSGRGGLRRRSLFCFPSCLSPHSLISVASSSNEVHAGLRQDLVRLFLHFEPTRLVSSNLDSCISE